MAVMMAVVAADQCLADRIYLVETHMVVVVVAVAAAAAAEAESPPPPQQWGDVDDNCDGIVAAEIAAIAVLLGAPSSDRHPQYRRPRRHADDDRRRSLFK